MREGIELCLSQRRDQGARPLNRRTADTIRTLCPAQPRRRRLPAGAEKTDVQRNRARVLQARLRQILTARPDRRARLPSHPARGTRLWR